MTRFALLLSSLFLGLSLIKAVDAGSICPLCGSVYAMPKRWDFILDTNTEPWTRCTDVYFEAASVPLGSDSCGEYQEKYKAVCCDDEIPDGWNVSPTPAPEPETGTEPECLICGTNEYPGIPNTIINARYVGTYSCGTLFHRGKNGFIPGFMCAPLQNYAQHTCGCGEHNPACKEDVRKCFDENDTDPSPITSKVPAPTKPPTPIYQRKTYPPGRTTKNHLRAYERYKSRGGRGLKDSSSLENLEEA